MTRLTGWLRKLFANADTDALDDVSVSSDAGVPLRWARNVMFAGLALLLILALTAPISQGVPTQGFIKVKGSSKTIQHLRGGIVDEVLVRDGNHVIAGQPLVRLNDVQLKAQLGILEAQLTPALAVEARLLAERNSAASVSFPPALLARDDSNARDLMRVQARLFAARRGTLVAEETINRESLAALEEQVRGLTAAVNAKREQLRLFRTEYQSLKPIFDEGFVPRTRMFELERAIAGLEGGLSEDISRVARTRTEINEIRARGGLTRNNYSKEVETQLAEIQKQIADANEKRTAYLDDLGRVILRSPVDGVVTGMAISTIGGVVAAGEKMMDIVPSDAGMTVEVQIPTHLIDSVRVGLPVDVNFVALDRTLVPTVTGRLSYVSADRRIDPARAEVSYYIGRVDMDEVEIVRLGKHIPQLGMPVEVVIKTGERTLAGYIFKPIFARMNVAFLDR